MISTGSARRRTILLRWPSAPLACNSPSPRATINSLAKQNIVLPFFNRFSNLLKAHRLFRQYLTIFTLPSLVAFLYTNNYFSGQTELLWAVHAERLNQK